MPKSNLAVIGLYYVKDGRRLLAAIEALMASGRQSHGEYYLADALQRLIDEGARLEAWPVAVWEDCGTWPAVLQTNRHLLGRMAHDVAEGTLGEGAVVLPPVVVEPGAEIRHSIVGPRVYVGAGGRIERSVVGPDVSLAAGCAVSEALVADTIADTGARIEAVTLAGSLIGAEARVRGAPERMNVGDSSEIDSSAGADEDLLGP